MDTAQKAERPLGAIRGVVDREHGDVEGLLRKYRAEIESRIQIAENQAWRREREQLELEGYLSRAAAVLGVEVQEPPDWTRVVAGANGAADRIRELELDLGRAQASLQRLEAAAAKAAQHTSALARIAQRLGLTTSTPGEVLRAVDALAQRAARPA